MARRHGLSRGLSQAPPSLPLTRAIGEAGGGGFTPLSLPSLVAWYDPSDLSTMFQDTAGTVPVTAAGQAVARINDKSGNGHHATQATGTAQPLLQQDGNGNYYLDFDGGDFLTFTVAGASATVAMFVGGSLDSMGLDYCAIGNLNTTTFTGSQVGVGSGGAARIRSGNGAALVNSQVAAVLTAATPFVISGRYAPTSQVARSNGTDSTPSTVTVSAGSTSYAIGRRSATVSAELWNGGMYGLFMCQSSVTLAQIQAAERYLAMKSGVFF